ncbi:hypothetical protein TcWFU_003758 [Taenia crassiceps]|uniref:PDZ domain-containing protein n=1 Tax=Taenia crassiceps TaxID=6207 RepID=A0ABR4QKT1_9CEST
MVREVYEHIYETVDVTGSDKVRAIATAKATVAAFAASEGHAHPRVVELPKTEEGLGFNVMGGKEQNSPIYISRIIPGGVAHRQGKLKRGDQLLSVNGISVENENHEKAVELLKSAQGTVRLVVRYTPKVLDEMEARRSSWLPCSKAATPVSMEEQELAWEQCSAVYNVILAAIIGTVIVVHFAFLLYALWDAAKRACFKQTHLRTHGADEVGEDEVPLTYTPDYVWYARDGKVPLRGLTQEDFIDFERYAHFVYAQSHES